MKRLGITEYSLEVLEQNKAAIALYQSCGFEKVTQFDCFQQVEQRLIVSEQAKNMDITYKEANPMLQNITSHTSWQNDSASLRNIPYKVMEATCFIDGQIVAQCWYSKETGEVYQFRTKINEIKPLISFIQILERSTMESLTWINIDNKEQTLIESLHALHYDCFATQLEMACVI